MPEFIGLARAELAAAGRLGVGLACQIDLPALRRVFGAARFDVLVALADRARAGGRFAGGHALPPDIRAAVLLLVIRASGRRIFPARRRRRCRLP